MIAFFEKKKMFNAKSKDRSAFVGLNEKQKDLVLNFISLIGITAFIVQVKSFLGSKIDFWDPKQRFLESTNRFLGGQKCCKVCQN